jgi:thioredoxin-like negative regulator of GroEL
MPLVTLSGAEAFANLKANRRSLWPDGRKDQSRLDGVAKVHFKPSFSLTPGEAVFTMGSCFARNIERRFSELGFELPTMALTLPPEERASDTENDLLNKYPPHSILNELRWALDPEAAFPEGGFFNVKKDLWHDPHLAGNVAPAPLERVIERRRMVEDIYRQVPRCRLVVMTLGLTEAWFDLETGYYLNAAPPQAAFKADPDRFRMDVMTVDEILAVLEQIRDLLMRFGHPQMRMMLTVSPVPFKATFTGRDAIIANSYSKSALRAAAEMFVFRHGNVDYVPSYEIVTHTARASAFIQDNRHITPSVVNEIVDRVVAAYCPGLASVQPPEDTSRISPTQLREYLQEGDFASAVGVFARLEKGQRYLRWGYTQFDYRLSYGKALAKLEGLAEAQAQLAKAVSLNPEDSEAHYNLGLVLAKLQRAIEAEEQIGTAVALDPESAEIRLRYARQLVANGKPEEGIRELRIAAEQHPGHRRVRAFLETVLASISSPQADGSAEAAGETDVEGRATTLS